jgi:hypothetical protein
MENGFDSRKEKRDEASILDRNSIAILRAITRCTESVEA